MRHLSFIHGHRFSIVCETGSIPYDVAFTRNKTEAFTPPKESRQRSILSKKKKKKKKHREKNERKNDASYLSFTTHCEVKTFLPPYYVIVELVTQRPMYA